MKRVDFSIKEGRAEYHAEREEHFTAKQKYTLALLIIGAVALIALVKMLGFWALGAALLAGFVVAVVKV